MSYLTDVNDYMEGLARLHKKLGHTDQELHYFRGEADEFWDKLRSDVRFPCMILEGTEIAYGGNVTNATKMRTCAFIIADRYDQRKQYDEIQEQMSGCEQIGEEVLGRMITEAGTSTSPFLGMKFGNITAEYLQNERDRYCGVRFVFEVKGTAKFCNTNAWNDPTPITDESGNQLNTETGDTITNEAN